MTPRARLTLGGARRRRPLEALRGARRLLGLLGLLLCLGEMPGAAAQDLAGREPQFQAALARIREGGCQLRQAARNGEPALLQEAEREVLAGLLDALDEAPRDPAHYARLETAVAGVAGLFKYVPYALEVRPDDGRPVLRLSLRRSAYPVVLARRGLAHWQSRLEGDVLVLTPRP